LPASARLLDLLPERLRSRVGGLFWGRAFAAGGQRTWMAEPAVRRYINQSVSGSPEVWPIEWLQSQLRAQLRSLPLERGVSLGCGDGPLERDLLAKRICRSLLGLDISREALEIARRLAAEAQLAGVEYRQANLNTLALDSGPFDAAFFHQSLHHVENLDHCLRTVSQALVPGALVYCDEYVGPSRADWKRASIAGADRLFQTLPRSVRRRSRLQLPVDWRDPTEAIRSAEIRAHVRQYFRVEQERPYGGNFLSVIHPHLALEGLDEAARDALLQEIIAAEREHLRSGAVSYYAVLVCRKSM
jgi:SAM-dependent methyltransferase